MDQGNLQSSYKIFLQVLVVSAIVFLLFTTKYDTFHLHTTSNKHIYISEKSTPQAVSQGQERSTQNPLDNLDTDVIIITNWTTKMKNQIWLQDGNQSFTSCANLAPSMKCWFDNRPEAFNKSHAVFFRGVHLFRGGPPPTYRPTGQKWILYETEPPTKTWGPRLDDTHPVWTQFNLTVTYTSDSTVPNNWHRRSCVLKPDWTPSGVNYASSKTGLVSWMVSHCNTSSLREAYVDRLKEYVQVDVYGACGVHTCPFSNACPMEDVNKEYKFYLSFENSLCEEYYTEKVVWTLTSPVVPIVLGGVDYASFMPPGSYLDVKNFTSPAHLAEYLLYLDNNDTAYNAYIENKFKYTCTNPSNTPFACRLCRHLHEYRYKEEKARDIRAFWGIKERCQDPEIYYRGVADNIIKN